MLHPDLFRGATEGETDQLGEIEDGEMPLAVRDLLTPSQWRGTLVIMAHRAALTPEESALMRQYLQVNARPPEE